MHNLANQEKLSEITHASDKKLAAFGKNANLARFIATGKSDMCNGLNPAFIDLDDYFWEIRSPEIKNQGYSLFFGGANATLWECDDYGSHGVLLKKGKRKKENKKDKFLFVSNSDAPSGRITAQPNHPSISFECVKRLIEETTPNYSSQDQRANEVAQLFIDGSLRILDYTADSIVKMTAKQQKTKQPIEIPKGYSVAMIWPHGKCFHRSSSVLFCDTRTEKFYLCGMDEDSYFGVELKSNVKTIEQAFVSMMPNAARVKGTQRQGEWFVVPVKEKDLPKRLATALKGWIKSRREMSPDKDYNATLSLPKDEPDSAYHHVVCEEAFVGIDGVVYACGKGNLIHENGDHDNVNFDGWVKFLHNVVQKSVSVEGAD